MSLTSNQSKPRDPDLVGAEAAMRRAAFVARRRSKMVPTDVARSIVSDSVQLDPRKLSFSQAQGYEELPEPLNLGELPTEARVQIWNALYFWLSRSTKFYVDEKYVVDPWKSILERVHAVYDGNPADEWDDRFTLVREGMRDRIERQAFNRVFDLIQFIMRDSQCPRDFVLHMCMVFGNCRLAYVIDSGPPPTIFPAATTEEGEAVLSSLRALDQGGLQGGASHLRKSAECINQGDWADSIRESVHAVESVARQLDSKASSSLAPAVRSLEKRSALHPALKQAWSKLYGYSSDEQGIRHALLDREQASVGMDEAVFMLGACASFASYLWRKHIAGSNP